MHPFFRQPRPSDDATAMNTVQDALAGIVIVALIAVALLWAPEIEEAVKIWRGM